MENSGPIRVMALHALAYCERLFYLEEVEEIRVADERVFDGRALHEALDEDGTLVEMTIESATLGIKGKLDALRRRDGKLIPYEHKKGRGRKADSGLEPWPSDRVQLAAYAMLLEEASGEPVAEGRIRYHADNQTVRVTIGDEARAAVRGAIDRARDLAKSTSRPPVTSNEKFCVRCSLAPVCLPEETRTSQDPERAATRLFPPDDERIPLHVVGHGTRIGRSGDELLITPLEGPATREPINTIRSVVVHGHNTISAQALQMCAEHGVTVHWFTGGGSYLGSFWRDDPAVQRRIRQFEALRADTIRLRLAQALVKARVESQLRFVLRATQGGDRDALGIADAVDNIRHMLGTVDRATDPAVLLGIEGQAAAAYFSCVPGLISEQADPRMRPRDRNRRPPRDPFNAMLSFGYGLLLREVTQAIRVVGLDGAFGFYHRPRSSAPPLALDLMELFRVPVVDMSVVAAINRQQFDADADFTRAGQQVWLSETGRKKLIEVFERRLSDAWRHPVLQYSLSYHRHIELEVRLLEKEWSGEPGLFATTRIR
ncbi:MAG: type I-MYXAN CRISPR-associated endonuclease Cas1 [Polyangia bacterium]